jgi:hypothetical protein
MSRNAYRSAADAESAAARTTNKRPEFRGVRRADPAEKTLNGHGRVAESALRKLLEGKPTLEARRRAERLLRPLDTLSTEEVRDLRAVEMLEAIATPVALALLRHWAEGANGTTLTRHARAARDRLNTR